MAVDTSQPITEVVIAPDQQITLSDWANFAGSNSYDSNNNLISGSPLPSLNLQNLTNILLSIFTKTNPNWVAGSTVSKYEPIFFGTLSNTGFSGGTINITINGGGITQDGQIILLNQPYSYSVAGISSSSLVYAYISPTPVSGTRVFVDVSGNANSKTSFVKNQYNLAFNSTPCSSVLNVASTLDNNLSSQSISAIPLYWINYSTNSVTDVAPYLGNESNNTFDSAEPNNGILNDSNSNTNLVYGKIRFLLKSILNAFTSFKGSTNNSGNNDWYNSVMTAIEGKASIVDPSTSSPANSRSFGGHINKDPKYPSDHQNPIDFATTTIGGQTTVGNFGVGGYTKDQDSIGSVLSVPDFTHTGGIRVWRGLNTLAFSIGLKLINPSSRFNGIDTLERDSTIGATNATYWEIANYNYDNGSSEQTDSSSQQTRILPGFSIIKPGNVRLPVWYDYIKSALRMNFVNTSSGGSLVSSNGCAVFAPDIGGMIGFNVQTPVGIPGRQYVSGSNFGTPTSYTGFFPTQTFTPPTNSSYSGIVNTMTVNFPSESPIGNVQLLGQYGTTHSGLNNNPLTVVALLILAPASINIYTVLRIYLNTNIVNQDYATMSINGRNCNFPINGSNTGNVVFATTSTPSGRYYLSATPILSQSINPTMYSTPIIGMYQGYFGSTELDYSTTQNSGTTVLTSANNPTAGWVEVNLLWLPIS